jgi:hypothetical protein
MRGNRKSTVEGEGDDIYGASLLPWQGRNFIVYQDHTSYRGGNVKYVELDSRLHPVGSRGERYTLIDPVPDSPIDNRYRGGEFYRENNTLYLYSGASKSPRVIVFATADAGPNPADSVPEAEVSSKHAGEVDTPPPAAHR